MFGDAPNPLWLAMVYGLQPAERNEHGASCVRANWSRRHQLWGPKVQSFQDIQSDSPWFFHDFSVFDCNSAILPLKSMTGLAPCLALGVVRASKGLESQTRSEGEFLWPRGLLEPTGWMWTVQRHVEHNRWWSTCQLYNSAQKNQHGIACLGCFRH